MAEKIEKISNVEANKEKQYPIPEYEGIDADRTFLKIAALLGVYREVVRLKTGIPVIPEYEQLGLNYLAEDVLADLDLLIYGERTWMGWMDTMSKEKV